MPIKLLNKNITAESDIILWKYLEFWKFESILKGNALFYCRLDRFPDDPLEGSTPKKVKEKRLKDIIGLELYYGNSNISKIHSQNKMISSFLNNVLRKQTVINCWHINESECEFMWNSYVKEDIEKGVVIKTNLTRLVKSFEQTPEQIDCISAHYIDYEKEDWLQNFDSFDMFAPFIHKDMGFIQENELRLLYQVPIYNGKELDNYWNQRDGMMINANINYLIEDVYCSPDCTDTKMQEINKTISNFGFSFTVKESRILKRKNPNS